MAEREERVGRLMRSVKGALYKIIALKEPGVIEARPLSEGGAHWMLFKRVDSTKSTGVTYDHATRTRDGRYVFTTPLGKAKRVGVLRFATEEELTRRDYLEQQRCERDAADDRKRVALLRRFVPELGEQEAQRLAKRPRLAHREIVECRDAESFIEWLIR